MDSHLGYRCILFHEDIASALMCNVGVRCLANHAILFQHYLASYSVYTLSIVRGNIEMH